MDYVAALSDDNDCSTGMCFYYSTLEKKLEAATRKSDNLTNLVDEYRASLEVCLFVCFSVVDKLPQELALSGALCSYDDDFTHPFKQQAKAELNNLKAENVLSKLNDQLREELEEKTRSLDSERQKMKELETEVTNPNTQLITVG